MTATQGDIDYLNQQLTLKLGFTPQDLRANQQAQLSPAQEQLVRARLRAHWHNTRSMVIGFLISYGVLFIVGLATMSSSQTGQNPRPVLESLALPMLIIGGLFAGVVMFALLNSVIAVRDLRRARVSWVEGSAHAVNDIVRFRSGGYPRYRLFIKQGRHNQRVFQLAEATGLEGFREGQPYRIYYIKYPPVHILLSGEAL